MTNQINFFKSLLDENSCSRADSFVISKAYEIRHTVQEQASLLQAYAAGVKDLPLTWLDDDRSFGPYEKFILDNIFKNWRNPMVFRSGSGSGKSSLFAYISEMYTRSATEEFKRKYRAKLRVASSIKKEQANCPDVNHFTTIFDLNPLRKTDTNDPVTLDLFKKQIVKKLADHLFSQLFLKLIQDVGTDFIAELITEIIFSDVKDYKGDGLTSSVLSILKMEYFSLDSSDCFNVQIVSETQSSDLRNLKNDQLKSISLLYKKLETEPEKLCFSIIAINAFVEKMKTEFGFDIPLLIIVDNLDALQPLVQKYLIEKLLSVFLKNEEKFVGMRVISVMRLSSASDLIGANKAVSMFKAHHAPDPLEILSVRLAEFMISYEHSKEFNDLPYDDQSLVYSKILYLWNLLRNSTSEFSTTLRALAGTNIRLCFQYAANWLVDHKVPDENLISDYSGHKELLQINLIESLISDICLSAVKSVMLITDVQQDWDKEKFDSAIESICFRITDTLYYWTKLIAHSDDIEGPRARIGISAHQKLPNINIKELHVFERDVTEALFHHILPMLREGILCDNSILTNWKQANYDDLIEYFSETELEAFAPITNSVDRILKLISDRVLQWHKDHSAGTTFQENRKSHRAMEGELLLSKIPRLNYRTGFDCTYGLFVPLASEKNGADLYPVNVFSSDGKNFSPMALRVLYKLSEDEAKLSNDTDITIYNNRVVSFGEILADLRDYCMNDLSGVSANSFLGLEEHIDTALSELIRTDRKLIFSSVHDELNGISDWRANRSRSVSLSWTGIRFIKELIHQPAYIQWAFDQCDLLQGITKTIIDADNVATRRIFAVYKCFEECLRREYETYIEMYEHHLNNCGLDDQTANEVFGIRSNYNAPMFDVYLRAQDTYLHALEKAVSSAQRNDGGGATDPTLKAYVLDVLNISAELEDKYIRLYEDLYGQKDERWVVDAYYSKQKRRLIQSAVE